MNAAGENWQCFLPGKLNSDGPFGLDGDIFAPELQLRVDGAVEHEVGAVRVERRHWRMVRHLLANNSAKKKNTPTFNVHSERGQKEEIMHLKSSRSSS
jgi:hypothetical protein